MDLVNEVLPLIMEWMPEVSPQAKSVTPKMSDRVKLTAAILVIYLIMSQVLPSLLHAPEFTASARLQCWSCLK